LEKTVQKIPFLRLTVALTAGIAIGSSIYFPVSLALVILFGLTILLFILHKKYRYSFTFGFGFGIHLVFIIIGNLIFQLYNTEPFFYKDGIFQATVLETPQEKPNSYKSLVRIEAFSNDSAICKAHENVIVYFEKDVKAKLLAPGENIVFRQNPERIKNSGNPYEFDYKKYLQRKKIYRQLYLRSESWNTTPVKPLFSSVILAEQTRESLLKIYRSQKLGEEQFKILSALTLGYKRELDPEIKQVFSASGAMHVLAVSGLHVGIIFVALTFIFGFLKNKRFGRILFVVFIVSSLWVYAFITGLSPSVERAAAMFSFVVAGNSLRRQISIYNSLAASAFILLLVNPNNLFEVGFQLSYSAVFGIVYLQPRLNKLYTTKNKLLNYLWALLTVSVAAQIATFPFTLYYFNQFPTFFWISNLFVIPAVTILIPLGITLLIVAPIPVLSSIISTTLNYIIYAVYFLLQQIEQLPFSVVYISIHSIEFTGVLISMIFFFLFLKTRRIYHIKTILITVFLMAVFSLLNNVRNFDRNEIIVYNSPENTIVHLISGKRNYVVSEYEIDKTAGVGNLVETTIRKLHLEEPLFINGNETFKDEKLIAQNGFLNFGGKQILFNWPDRSIPWEIKPDLIINPVYSARSDTTHFQSVKFISNKKYIPRNFQHSAQVYHVQRQGAFREKW
jgi:competence protein ComEC